MADQQRKYAGLLRNLDFAANEFDGSSAIYEDSAAAIRELEAKVRELEEWKQLQLQSMAMSASMTPGRELLEARAELAAEREKVRAADERNTKQLIAYAELIDDSEALGGLLAVIHRDGGHYRRQHGAEKAAEDAEEIVAQLFAEREASKVLESALAEAREDTERLTFVFSDQRYDSDAVENLYLRMFEQEWPTMPEVRAAIDAARGAKESPH